MELETELPDGFEAGYEDGILRIESGGEEVEKELDHALVDVKVEDGRILFSTSSDRKDVESIVKTFQSHAGNMVKGLQEGFVYRLKGVYAHFPMTIKQDSGRVLIENFMGERAPREIEILENVEVSINGEDVEVSGPDKEKVAQTAASIEQACGKGDRDPRTFQDGVYMVKGDTE